jgi:DeoR/GlpR family transcriptional regulator of sugar metabolism
MRRAFLQRQGAKPSVQELADLLGVSARTVKRDLVVLKKTQRQS